MAIVGDAYIVVRALTDKVEGDIRRGFSGVEGAGRQAGEKMGDAFTRGFNRKSGSNVFTKFSEGIKTMAPEAERARVAFAKLTRVTYVAGTAVGGLIGGLSALVGGLGAIIGSAGGAAASLIVVGNTFAAVKIGAFAAKLALSGVSKALSQLNNSAGGSAIADNTRQIAEAERALALVIENNRERLIDANNDVRQAQLDLNEAFKAGREEIQQIGFEAEDAALAEQQAAIDLTKAREVLARVQDLPPNSRVRKEAELAYQEAELNLRKAKDRSADLNKEQDRLARTGVSGTTAVVNATQRLAEAEAAKAKAVRDSIRDQVSAEESLADAKNNSASAGGGINPFEGLNEYQVRFVQFLQGLKPLYEELKVAASEAFLPPLEKAIQLLADKAFPTIKTGISLVAEAMGNAAISLADAITNSENLTDLSVVFSSSATIIEKLGRVLGNVWDSALTLLAAAAPLAERFVSFLEDKSKALANFLDTKQASGELRNFFDTAGDIMAQLGTIFGNVFEGFGQIIMANFGPGTGGGYLLDWLTTATDKFANLDKLAGGQSNLESYFLGAATNAQKVSSSVGALLTELIKLGDNKDIGRTFDILATGADSVGRIAEKFIEAGPAMAGFVTQFVEFIDKMTDTGAIEIFFTTLGDFLKSVNDILDNETAKAFLDYIGRIGAVGLAFGSIYKAGKFLFDYVLGAMGLITGGMGKVVGAFGFMKLAVMGVGVEADAARIKLMGMVKGAGWLALIGAVISGFAGLNETMSLSSVEADRVAKSFDNIKSKNINSMFDVKMDPFWYSASNNINDLNGALDSLAGGGLAQANYGLGKFTTSVFSFIPGVKENYDLLTKNEAQLKTYGESLAGLAATHLPAAELKFRQLSQAAGGGEEVNKRLLATMPAYREQLIAIAEANGMATDEQSLLNLATGEGEAATKLAKIAFEESSAAVYDQTGKVQELSDKIKNFSNEVWTAKNNEIEYQQSIDDMTDSLIKNGANFDTNSQQGRDNWRALQDVASAANAAAAETYAQDGSIENLTTTMEANRKQMIDTMMQAGVSEEAAKGYVDQLMMTPEQIQTEVATKDIPKSKNEIADYYNNTAKDKTITTTAKANTEQAKADFEAFLRNLPALFGIVLKVTLPQWAKNLLGIQNANGGLYAFANGGMVGPGVYKGRPGALYKFAEPETKWEAFISGKPGQEKRNIEIWQEAGRRLGVLADANSTGGLYNVMGATSSSSSSSADTATVNQETINNISITVNPSPGMNETELAAAVSREITFQMRRGAVA